MNRIHQRLFETDIVKIYMQNFNLKVMYKVGGWYCAKFKTTIYHHTKHQPNTSMGLEIMRSKNVKHKTVWDFDLKGMYWSRDGIA